MTRSIAVVGAAAALALAACGSAANAAKSSPSPGAGNAFRNGASGQLVQINGQTLILTGPNGDTTVTYTTATTFTKTSAGTIADITRGTCIVASGQNDATGPLVATMVRISPKTAAGCTIADLRPSPSPRQSPLPSPSPRPNGAFVSGEVTAVSGLSVTVLSQANGTQTVTVASAATITDSAEVTASALQNGQCLRASGSTDAAGGMQATSITIMPAGPSGTCATGLGPGRNGPGGGAPPGSGGTQG